MKNLFTDLPSSLQTGFGAENHSLWPQVQTSGCMQVCCSYCGRRPPFAWCCWPTPRPGGFLCSSRPSYKWWLMMTVGRSLRLVGVNVRSHILLWLLVSLRIPDTQKSGGKDVLHMERKGRDKALKKFRQPGEWSLVLKQYPQRNRIHASGARRTEAASLKPEKKNEWAPESKTCSRQSHSRNARGMLLLSNIGKIKENKQKDAPSGNRKALFEMALFKRKWPGWR